MQQSTKYFQILFLSGPEAYLDFWAATQSLLLGPVILVRHMTNFYEIVASTNFVFK